jgi:DNA-binding NtrC family response regulator
MPSISTKSGPARVLGNSVHESAKLRRHTLALIVSPNIEVCRALIGTLEGLSTDVIVCSTETQAEEVLSRQTVDVVFCDENLLGGSHHVLIHANHWDHRMGVIRALRAEGQLASSRAGG